MKPFFAFVIVILMPVICFSQKHDTLKIYNAKEIKKGFYRTYDDYINNSPFIVTDFSLVGYRLSKKDSTVIAVEYRFGDSKTKIPNLWGLSDGHNVYIHYPAYDLNPLCYKLEYIGPYPYFTYIEKQHLHFIAPLADAIFSTAANLAITPSIPGLIFSVVNDLLPVPYSVFVVTPKEKIKNVFNRNYMKKLFSSQPDLLNSYEKSKDSTTLKQLKQYLIQFNERLK